MIIGTGAETAAIDATSKAGGYKDKLDEDLNAFLTLLVTQLQNQDPLDPMDATEFTSQLVQFASVEQQIYQNANLEKLLEVQQQAQVSNLVNYLGTTVEVAGDLMPLVDGYALSTYTLDSKAAKVTLTVLDEDGKTVFTQAGESEGGYHEFEWDGVDKNGIDLPDGAYRLQVDAYDRDGEVIDVKQTIFGHVTGAGSEQGAVSLFLSDILVPLDKVLSVKETPAKTEQ
ncbi:MAG: flagellar hook assembly protein FlgD [Rhodospirillales bacterium]|nr:flagellar hook assembly protein FlgD [Rhodospirillales bacterium]